MNSENTVDKDESDGADAVGAAIGSSPNALWLNPPAPDGRRLALHEAAAAGRDLVSALIGSPATAQQLRDAAEQLRAIVGALPTAHSTRPVVPEQHGIAFLDQSPVIGLGNIVAPPMSMAMVDGHVEATVTFGDAYEGPPGHVHGGWIAAAFDDVLGMAQTLSGQAGMTGRLETTYRAPTPLHQPIHLRADLLRVEGRKIFTSATSHSADGRLLAEATGLFIAIDYGVFAAMVRSGEAQ